MQNMVNEIDISSPKEFQTLITGESCAATNSEESEFSKLNSISTKNVEITIEKDENVPHIDDQKLVISVFNTFKISIHKPLLPLRIALFLWYGVGWIPVDYLNIFMKQKGISLVEYSWIFSLASLFQFLFAFASGIIADKLGHAKSVLMTHVFITFVCVLSFLFSPNVDLRNGFPENASEIHLKESLKNFQICDELKGSLQHSSAGVPHSEEILKFGNYSEETLRQIVENCKEFNATTFLRVGNVPRGLENSVMKTKVIDANYSHAKKKLLCKKPTENCTELSDINLKIVSVAPNWYIIIFAYFIPLLLFLSSWSTVYRFMDVTIMSFTSKHNVNFGYEQFFSMSGYTFMTILTSLMWNQFSLIGQKSTYQSVYGFSACIIFLSLVSIYFIKLEIKPHNKHMLKEGFSFIRNQDVVVFITLVFLLGSSFGFIDSFCLWYLEHLDAPPVVLDLHKIFYGLYGLPFLFTSKWWLKKFGPRILIFVGFFGYVFFGFAISFLYNPWLFLLLESSCIFTYHLLWVAVIVHVHNMAPECLTSTIIAVTGATHYSLGRGVGSPGFGLAVDCLGPRVTLRIFAGMNILYALGYILFVFTRKTRVVRREVL